jgi:hypothetical protein
MCAEINSDLEAHTKAYYMFSYFKPYHTAKGNKPGEK